EIPGTNRPKSLAQIEPKYPVVTYTLIMANSYWCGVYKGYSCALTQATSFHEKNKWQKISLHQFYKSIVRNRFWKFLFHVFLDIENVKVFEVLKTTYMV